MKNPFNDQDFSVQGTVQTSVHVVDHGNNLYTVFFTTDTQPNLTQLAIDDLFIRDQKVLVANIHEQFQHVSNAKEAKRAVVEVAKQGNTDGDEKNPTPRIITNLGEFVGMFGKCVEVEEHNVETGKELVGCR